MTAIVICKISDLYDEILQHGQYLNRIFVWRVIFRITCRMI